MERRYAFMEIFITLNLLVITVNTAETLMTVNLLASQLTLHISIPIKEQKFKAFIKPFETPQGNVEIKI